MRITQDKIDAFSKKELNLAKFARVLSHPARLAILRILAEKKACICGEIVSELPLAQSTVSEHLRELKMAGLIRGETEGPSVCYCIDYENLNSFFKDLTEFGSLLGKGCFDENCCK